jgi:hypothetical protein
LGICSSGWARFDSPKEFAVGDDLRHFRGTMEIRAVLVDFLGGCQTYAAKALKRSQVLEPLGF